MSDSKTVITIPKSDFTASSGVVNTSIFEQELNALSLSVGVVSVRSVGTDIEVTLDDIGVPADVTSIDGAVSSHAGDSFSNEFQSVSAAEDVLAGQAAIEATTSTPVVVYEHDSGPLPGGQYQILWSAEHRVDAEETGEDSALLVEVDLGAGYVELSADSNQSEKDHSFSNGMVLDRLDGQRIKVKMSLSKTGSGDSKAILRRARLVHFRLS